MSGGRTVGAGVWGTGRVLDRFRRSKIAPLGVVPPGGDFIWANAACTAPALRTATAVTSAVRHRMVRLSHSSRRRAAGGLRTARERSTQEPSRQAVAQRAVLDDEVVAHCRALLSRLIRRRGSPRARRRDAWRRPALAPSVGARRRLGRSTRSTGSRPLHSFRAVSLP